MFQYIKYTQVRSVQRIDNASVSGLVVASARHAADRTEMQMCESVLRSGNKERRKASSAKQDFVDWHLKREGRRKGVFLIAWVRAASKPSNGDSEKKLSCRWKDP